MKQKHRYWQNRVFLFDLLNHTLCERLSFTNYEWRVTMIFIQFFLSFTHSLHQHLSDICDGSPDTPFLHAGLDFSWCLSDVLTQKINNRSWLVFPHFFTLHTFHSTRSDTICLGDILDSDQQTGGVSFWSYHSLWKDPHKAVYCSYVPSSECQGLI